MRYKLLALDIDGTLVTRQGRLSSKTKDAIERAREAGLRIALCTGRRFTTTRPFALELGLDMPLVLHHGALVKEASTGSLLRALSLERGKWQTTVRCFREFGLPAILFTEPPPAGGDFLIERRASSNSGYDSYVIKNSQYAVFVEDLLADVRAGVLDVATYAVDDEIVGECGEVLRREMGEGVLTSIVPQGRHSYAGTCLEVLPARASKWNALLFVAGRFGIRPEEIAAIGDATNDIEMISKAGLGIAMGDASSELRAAADHVTGDCDSDGVAEAIDRFIL